MIEIDLKKQNRPQFLKTSYVRLYDFMLKSKIYLSKLAM